MMITKIGQTLQLGKDLVDALTGEPVSHGSLEINNNGKRLDWQSTLPIAETEHYFRITAKDEGKNITLFISQAL